MKKTSLTVVIIMLCGMVNAQTWRAMSGLRPYIKYPTFGVDAIAEYNGKIIVSGLFDSAGKASVNDFMARWNGSEWDTVFSSLYGWQSSGPAWSNDVWAFANWHNKLYIGGSIYAVNNEPASDVIAWDGKSWNNVGSMAGYGLANFVFTMTVYNNELIAAGDFYYFGTIANANNIIAWNDTAWVKLGNGIRGTVFVPVDALASYNGNLYAGGHFDSAGNIATTNIAQWNGTRWSAVGGGVNNTVNSLIVYNGELYVAGNFDSAGGKPLQAIAKWDGTTWSQVGNGLTCSAVGNMIINDGKLVVVEAFNNSKGVAYADDIVEWDGISWSTIPSSRTNAPQFINALASYNGNLYVGGDFDSIGGIHANYIAEYCPDGCFTSDTIPTAFKVYPNPASGIFTFQSPLSSGQLSVEIYNVLGQKVYSQFNIRHSTFNIDLSSYANGVYFYRITAESGAKIATGKLVKQ